MRWDFVPGKVTYAKRGSDHLPHLEIQVLADGQRVGYLEVHMHRHAGKDKQTDVSFGVTAIVERMPEPKP